jgi:hypothetical protein
MAEPEEIVDMEAMFDLKNAKKKKKKPKTVVAEENPDAIVTSGGVAPGDGSGANDAGSVSTVPVGMFFSVIVVKIKLPLCQNSTLR